MRERVHGLTPSQAEFTPTTRGWSIAEIVEHVSIVDGQLVQLVTTLLKKSEDAGRTASSLHAEKHLSQIESVMASPEFPEAMR